MTCLEMEVAVSSLFDYRKEIIVPNISWGAGLHECDLLIINKNGFATEVEIKISYQDLKKDFSKDHNHESEKIKNLYYAIPLHLLEKALPLIPEHAGIITVEKYISACDNLEYKSAKFYRRAAPKHKYRAMTKDEMFKIAVLGCMRIFPLKAKLIKKYSKNQTKLEL